MPEAGEMSREVDGPIPTSTEDAHCVIANVAEIVDFLSLRRKKIDVCDGFCFILFTFIFFWAAALKGQTGAGLGKIACCRNIYAH